MSKKYFVRANTSSGAVNLIDSCIANADQVYAVGGKSKTAKTELMNTVCKYFELKGMHTQYLVSPFDIRTLDGIIIDDIGFLMADEECLGNVRGKFVGTDNFVAKTEVSDEYLSELLEKSEEAINELYRSYKTAKAIHDDWEKIYIANTDYKRLESYTSGIAEQLITGNGDGGKYSEGFFGASTPDGSVNYIDNLTEGLSKRYFIKGRPGTGKSTFLKKLAASAREHGYGSEVYYCSFDKNSLDMVIVPELSLCVFDSTAPHEMFPKDSRDSVLDFYTESGLSGVDEKFNKELENIETKYRFRIHEGVSRLRLAIGYLQEREYYFKRATDFMEITRTADKIARQIM